MTMNVFSKKYRIDVIGMILLPILVTLGAMFVLGGKSDDPGMSPIHAAALVVIVAVGLVTEAWTLWELGDAGSRDRGILSGLMTGSVLAAPVADRFMFQVLQIQAAPRLDLVLGALMFLGGTALRWNAKQHLKEFFSHSIRVLPEHKVITSGPYGLIKHPAYFGTLLIVIGNSLMFDSWMGLILVLAVLPWAWKRMDREEALLTKELGGAYAEYSRRVKRIIPWVV
jgi:protein-S-isoprenylcysteine O-methyltransferase Ste14